MRKRKLFIFFLVIFGFCTLTSADVEINETTFPDENFRNWVLSQEYGKDGVLTDEEIGNVTFIEVMSHLGIHSLKGIEYLTALKELTVRSNKLTELDLSRNMAIETLDCSYNALTAINLSKSNALLTLKCMSNQLTALDVSKCAKMQELLCSGNQLTTLDVSNNTALTKLECYENQLTALNLTKNTAMTWLRCNDNQLTALDVSKNTGLTWLTCNGNRLTALDVSKNTALSYLQCMSNELATLSASNIKTLETLHCFDNQLTTLDVSRCSALTDLQCNDNLLATLDVSGCAVLKALNCNYNQLTTLDLSENTALTNVSCMQNQIKGEGMDALVESLPTVSEGKLVIIRYQDEQNIMTKAQVVVARAKGWTPQRWDPYILWTDYEGSDDATTTYFPEGTRWTEIRLDTLKYDSWYSKVGDEWLPNFETIEYRVQGEYTDHNLKFKKVYSNGPEWTDSLALLIYDNGYDKRVSASVLVQDLEYVLWPAEVYQFDWSVGKGLYYRDIMDANSTDILPELYYYGVIDEIKEGYFGGVRPLKYVDLNGKAPAMDDAFYDAYYHDTNGGRIIQGIGITEWNDGECLFGPPNPYSALSNYEYLPQRHYRSMLVHFESGGEVLYDVWPKKEAIEVESVTFTRDQMATIVLPTEPDASKGKYYRLDRVEGNEIIFEQELQPRAHVPYIIVPSEDFSIEVDAMELAGLRNDTARVEGIRFIGTFQKEEVESQEGFYIELIDTTPDCSLSPSGEAGRDVYTIGTLRAYLLVHWDDPYHPGGTKVPAEKMEIVLKDNPDSIEIVNSKSSNSKCYDLGGHQLSKPQRGVNIIEGRKLMVK